MRPATGSKPRLRYLRKSALATFDEKTSSYEQQLGMNGRSLPMRFPGAIQDLIRSTTTHEGDS